MTNSEITLLKTSLLLSSGHLELILPYLTHLITNNKNKKLDQDGDYTIDRYLKIQSIMALLLVNVDEYEPSENLAFVADLIKLPQLNEANSDKELIEQEQEQEQYDEIETLITDLMIQLNLDQDVITLTQKGSFLKSTLCASAEEYGYNCENSDSELSGVSNWVRARLRKCYACDSKMNNDKTVNLQLLIDLVDKSDTLFTYWIQQVWDPLCYYNEIKTGTEFVAIQTVAQFEDVSVVERLNLLTSKLLEKDQLELNAMIQRFVRSVDDELILECLHGMNGKSEERRFVMCCKVIQLKPESELLCSQLVKLCYSYEQTLSDSILSTMLETIQLFHISHKANAELTELLNLVKTSMILSDRLPLKTLQSLSKDAEDQQKYLQTYLQTLKTNEYSSKSSQLAIDQLRSIKDTIIPLIDTAQFEQALVTRLIRARSFSYLGSHQDLLESYPLELLCDEFWKSFKLADSIDATKGQISNAVEVLKLIDIRQQPDTATEEIKRLHGLINSLQLLSQYSLTATRSHSSFTPSNLLSLDSTAPLFSTILELNPKAYRQKPHLIELQSVLCSSLQSVKPISELHLSTLCIESSLTSDDLPFAITASLKLLNNTTNTTSDSDSLAHYWVTFLQVAKHVPFSSGAQDYNVEQVKSQMEIIMKVLTFVKGQDSTSCLSQWESLNQRLMELEDLDANGNQGFDIFALRPHNSTQNQTNRSQGNLNLPNLDLNRAVSDVAGPGLRELSENGKGLMRKFGEFF
ncbi:hypothetical protein WICPIJ_001252 [Wickerhamomyces pijperi]|uniref:Sec39 domain-containing protein n=1 Tax=Wickerhamomyces pijperi TaxID=599730 RepID=A0A9P8TQ31_WICPI|nr:hypothetical protein WICPIJ_001252 [Wickerhamomyces pijperi]